MAEEKKENTAKIDQSKQEKIKAKTESENKDDAVKAQNPEELRAALSNKNADYVFRLQKELENQGNMSSEDAKAKVDALLPEIVVAQRHGQPANGLYMASPSIKAGQILHPTQKPRTFMDIPFWQRAVDNGLLWLAIFMALYGVLGLFSTDKNQAGQYGVLTIIIVGVALGVLTAKYNEWVMPNGEKKISWLRVILISVALVVVMLVATLLLQLPALKVINPVLPGIVYLIIAAIAYGARYLFRRQYHIIGSAFGQTTSQNKGK